MKKLFGLFLLTFFIVDSSLVKADDHEEKGEISAEQFNIRKTEKLKRIDEKINALNESKNCITAATDRAALRACNEKAMSAHKIFKEKIETERKKRHEDKKNKKKK